MLNMLTVKDISNIFKCSDNYVRETLCSIKGFPFVRIGKRYFFDEEAVHKWIENNYGITYK